VKLIHKLSLALAGALLLAAALVVPLASASEAQPEVTDVKGDAASRKDSRDLTAAFFHTETNDSFMVNLTLVALETYTTPSEIQNAPTTEYEVYFSVGTSNFAVGCKVPIHGPLGFTIQFDLRSVSYGNNSTTESPLGTLSGCRYDVAGHSIQWLVPKSQFGNITAGTHLTKTWAAVYNKNFGDTIRKIEDRGPTNGYGKDYIIRGTPGAEIIDVRLSVDNQTQACKPNEPAVFKLSVFNNGTSQISIDLFNSTPDRGWTVEFSLTNLTIAANVTRTVSVLVACPRNAANRTSAIISVYGKITVAGSNQTSQTNTLYLTSKVNYIPPKPVEDTFLVKLLKFFTKPTLMTYLVLALIVVAIAGGGAGIAVRRMRRRRDEAPVPAMPTSLPMK